MSIIEKAIEKLNQHKNGEVRKEMPAAQSGNRIQFAAHSAEQRVKFNIETLSAAGIISPTTETPFLADEFRRIKRPLLNNAFGKSSGLVGYGNVIMVTSSLPGEGKSFTAANLALSIALEKDYTVLLIDADVAMSKITRMFALDEQSGLTDVLENQVADLGDVIVKTDFPCLSIIPSGHKNPHATELLGSQAMKDLVMEIASRYSNRIIIFDSPPLLATPESAVLAEQMGQIVIVVEANRTPKSAVQDAINQLNRDIAISLVLNKTSKNMSYMQYGSYYGTGYGYGQEQQ